jgi:uncharacterized protein YfbU (UPF0304 family)
MSSNNDDIDLSSQATNARAVLYNEIPDFPVVFIPGEFSFRMFGKYVNPEYWGFNSLAEKFSQRTDTNFIFTTTGLLQSAHDAACDVFAQIYGGLADYGECHSNVFGHDRYGSVLYPAQIDRWDASNPIILMCHGKGALVAQMLQYLLSIDHFQKGSDASWIKGIITVNGAFNGTPLASALGIKTCRCKLIVPAYLQILIRIVVLIVWFLTKLCILPRGVLDPYNADSIYTAFSFKNSKGKNILENRDNSLYEYEFCGAKRFQEKYVCPNEDTLYLNVVSNTNINNQRYLPCPSVFNPLNPFTNLIISKYGTPCKFREKDVVRKTSNKYSFLNDGLVTMLSQTYPYLANSRPNPQVNSKFRSEEVSSLQIHRNYLKVKCLIQQLIDGVPLEIPELPPADEEVDESERTSNPNDEDIPLKDIRLFNKGRYYYFVSSTRPDIGNYGLSEIPSKLSTTLLYPDFRDRVALYRALIDYSRLYCKFEALQSKIAIAEELVRIKLEEKDTQLAIDIRTLQKTCNINSKVEVLFIDKACEIIDISDLEAQLDPFKMVYADANAANLTQKIDPTSAQVTNYAGASTSPSTDLEIAVENFNQYVDDINSENDQKIMDLMQLFVALKALIVLFEQTSKSNVTLLLQIIELKQQIQDIYDNCPPIVTKDVMYTQNPKDLLFAYLAAMFNLLNNRACDTPLDNINMFDVNGVMYTEVTYVNYVSESLLSFVARMYTVSLETQQLVPVDILFDSYGLVDFAITHSQDENNDLAYTSEFEDFVEYLVAAGDYNRCAINEEPSFSFDCNGLP